MNLAVVLDLYWGKPHYLSFLPFSQVTQAGDSYVRAIYVLKTLASDATTHVLYIILSKLF